MGVLGGAVEENRGPHLTSALLIPPSERLRCTDFDPGPLARPPSHFLPSAASSPYRPHLRVGPGLKSSPARIALRLCSRLPPSGQPTGKSDGGGDGGAGRGGRRESWAPPDLGSAHPAERAFTVYRFRPGPARPAAVAFPSLRRFLTVRTCLPTPMEKFRRTAAPMTLRLCSRPQ